LPTLGLLDVSDLLEWIFLIIFPNFAFGIAMSDLYNNYEANQVCAMAVPLCDLGIKNLCCIDYKNLGPNPCEPFDCLQWTPNYMDWRRPGLLRFYVFLPLQFIIQFLIILMYEIGYLRKFIYIIKQLFVFKRDLVASENERVEIEQLYGDFAKDNDVVDEEKRIFRLSMDLASHASNDLLIIDRLRKYYGSFMAVKGISFGIKPKECFGLLGVNGAGKTTTFKMLTGDEEITTGNAYLKGVDIKNDLKEANMENDRGPKKRQPFR
jgi:ATP-binding cassette subfamily A (ABC1) protein 3